MKKILSLLIVFSMLISFVAVYAEDETLPAYVYDTKVYGDAGSLMQSLLGAGVFGTDPALEVTRAQFTAGAAAIFGIPPVADSEPVYSDVAADNIYAGYIAAAHSAGWISPADKFNPDSPVTLEQAVKILLTAAQYSVMADAKGGYPTGYLTVANSIDLLDSIDTANSDKVTVADATILFYNLMFAPVFDIVSYGDNLGYEKGGQNYLEKLYDAYSIEGIVTATNHSAIIPDTELIIDNDTIEIDGIEYRYPGADPDILGKAVTAYLDGSNKQTNNIICLIEENTNNEVELIAEDYSGIRGTTFEYYSNDKIKRERLEPAYKVIYNGRCVPGTVTDEMLTDSFAKIRLLDSDGDSVYEIVFIESYTYLKIANVDHFTGYISFSDEPGSFINLGGEEDVLCNIYDLSGKKLELFELTSGHVAGVKSSIDGLMHELVILSEETVAGRVTSLDADNNIIVLEDTEYATSLDFAKKYITTDYIDVGDAVNAYVGLGGELVYLAERTSEYVYGMLADAKSSDGMESSLMLEIFTADGFTTMYAADKISFDSGTKLSDVSAALEVVSGHINADKPEIIRYSTNADGEVTHIDFASDETANTSYDPLSLRSEYDRLAKIRTVTNVNYRSDASGLVSNAILSEATMIVDNGSAVADRDKRYKFSSMLSLTSNMTYSMDLYDIDEHGYADFAFVTGGSTDGAKNISLKTYIIEKANRGVSGDYEGYRLTCYGEGSYGSYFLPEDSLYADSTGAKRPPQPGDLIRFTIKNGDVIDEYYTDFVYEADDSLPMYKKVIGTYMEESAGGRIYGQLINNDTSGAASANGIYTNAGYGEAYIADLQGRYGAGFVTGYVYNSEKSIVLCNGGADYIMANMRPYTLPNTVVLFDTQARKVTVTPYMSSAIKNHKANPGEEDFVVLRCSAGKPQVAFVYR